LSKKIRGQPGRRRAAAVRAAATKALASLLQPLAGFVLDSGLSVRELEVLFRTAAVLSVAQRQRASHQRVNISGIAATTGIPRAEISQILRMPERQAQAKLSAPSPISRILGAWYEEPGYQKPNGKPAELKVFGPAPSFEALVKKHGGGLPARAVLDELTRIGVSEVFGIQRVRTTIPAAVHSAIDPEAIAAVAAKAIHFFSSFPEVGNSQRFDFLSGISAATIDVSQLPVFRREVAARAADFVSAMRENLTTNGGHRAVSAKSGKQVVNIAVIYKEGLLSSDEKRSNKLRRNLRRLPPLHGK
jgi:hypothetical protein